ncbi:phenylalanine 4-monooxygenase [Nocardia terpenica]|uniref:phenylalanine 4-monooxygenase n=1 Tax=Nocardia terpenica TaxID=455432 RepID=UPI001895091E|nr:phenylalanine 4-monooxygenase [Nocardia terpenica]MBF6061835.1 phenylalanine 4-monooxygenase [Nocardia terpenica]MBF6106364.1 phenylalanine 4-monooxygenase [Nocardia terpenica]MBF6110255.1 phenylalanine 4-monooxygenase [Nocardia terpenica]MBF6120908.1 phenylalanine 4-monooxygenase [Nocardia terpenica]MBF6151591.1 phenylalanine 4-monooxygenase [Nocardia terpenica]
MFNEAQLYSPVTTTTDGGVTVHLSDEHPGVHDPEYRARRNGIAAQALSYRDGGPLPRIAYTDEEEEVWRIVSAELARKHRKLASAEVLAGQERLGLPVDHIPQLDEVTVKLVPLSGFRYVPAAGLVPLRQFFGSFADRTFHSTQYIRHHSAPLYTPEPDAIHEIIGHANQLASPRFAAIYAEVGAAVARLETDAALKFLADVFWFSMEFGVVRERGEVRCYGAGLLSSYGEIEEFRDAELRPLNITEMGTAVYDITHYQPVLYCAKSISEIEDVVGGFFATMTDDVVARQRATAGLA